jgi:hypothetical protein
MKEDENLNPNQLESLNSELHIFFYKLFHKQLRIENSSS